MGVYIFWSEQPLQRREWTDIIRMNKIGQLYFMEGHVLDFSKRKARS
jgi:hypothetical protein